MSDDGKLTGKEDQGNGRGKEAAGTVMNDPELEGEGRDLQAKGTVREHVHDIREHGEDVADEMIHHKG